MLPTETQLLNNLLDCLDRLFDGKTNAIDVRDLVYATLAALPETKHAAILQRTEKELTAIVRAAASPAASRDAALEATDDLRQHLASGLRFSE